MWSLVLLLVTGVRADPKYVLLLNESYHIPGIGIYGRSVTFDFSLEYYISY